MKPDAALKHYFKKRTKALDLLLKKPPQQYSVDDFHAVRVEIKKLRALFVLLDFCSKKFSAKKYFKPFKKIFDRAGKIRELQLEELEINEHEPDHWFTDYLEVLAVKEMKERKNFFSTVYRNVNRVKGKSGQIIPYFKNIKKNVLGKYIKDEKNKIISVIRRKTLNASDIHELRKALKRLYYNLKSLHLKDKRQAFKNGEALQKLMGKWHDCRVMSRHILKVTNKHKIANETEQLRDVARQLTMESRQLFNEINVEKNKQVV